MQTVFALLALCDVNPPVTNGFHPNGYSNAMFWCVLHNMVNKKNTSYVSVMYKPEELRAKYYAICKTATASDVKLLFTS